MSGINKRVARGVRYLDGKAPGWESKITRPLDLGHNQNCVIGQVFGDFYEHTGMGAWFNFRGLAKMPFAIVWGARHGFLGDEETVSEWDRVLAERSEAERQVVIHAENIARAEYIRSRVGV